MQHLSLAIGEALERVVPLTAPADKLADDCRVDLQAQALAFVGGKHSGPAAVGVLGRVGSASLTRK